MTRMKRNLLAVAALASYGLAAWAQKPAVSTPTTLSIPVTVTGPLPLPVSGAVSGTVSAQESGIWNVGITGTPSVSIGNTPTVNLAPPTLPLPFRNADEPGRIPYQSTQAATKSCSQSSCSWAFPVVQANYRLVVQHVSAYLNFGNATPGTSSGLVYLNTATGNPVSAFTLPPISPATEVSLSTLAFDQGVLVYVDGGSQMIVQVGFNAASPLAPNPLSSGSISATGYLLDCSAAPCAAIAQ